MRRIPLPVFATRTSCGLLLELPAFARVRARWDDEDMLGLHPSILCTLYVALAVGPAVQSPCPAA